MRYLTFLFSFLLMASLASCSSSSKKTEEPVQQPAVVDHSKWLASNNARLVKIPVDGFKYKGTEVPAKKWNKWAADNATVIKKVIDEIPEGYVLEVKGHTDARGPEEPDGEKPGNIRISQDRADTVMRALKNQGVPADKMTTTGVGSSELKPGVAPKSPEQRRVTFTIIKG